MRWVWYLLSVPICTLSIVAGVTLPLPQHTLAPALESPHTGEPELPIAHSLEDLYQLRDRLRMKLNSSKSTPTVAGISILPTSTQLLETLQATEIRIQVEETALRNWDRAIAAAKQATELGQQPAPSKATIATIYSLWKQAVLALEQVPKKTFLAPSAVEKLTDYNASLAIASYHYDTARSEFLKTIAERTGLPPENVFITVCHLSGECRRWQGNRYPASPASLIKLPVAIALMQKVTDQTIDLDTKITVSRSNYTEDASDIWVGTDYSLRKLLMRMINQSSNIATNQLIDYLGQDYINQVLRDRSFSATVVYSKLVGNYTYPANLGSQPNRFTTDELTEMMRQIYLEQHPGDDLLIEALASQYDTVLGYDGLRNSKAIWLGEKTGQNSKMLGTTFAFTLSGESYVATVALNYTASEAILRRCVNAIAKHIEQEKHL